MLIGNKSERYLKYTKSKEKMYEYFVAEDEHIKLPMDLEDLFISTISILGDYCVSIINEEKSQINELKDQLNFCSNYFEAFLNGKINEKYNEYMRLITAATYYLCDKVGNANLMISIFNQIINIGVGGLENLLICILKNQYNLCDDIGKEMKHKTFIEEYLHFYNLAFSTGDFEELYKKILDYRKNIYSEGTARELLVIDIISAILKIKISRFSIVAIPKYTNIDVSKWRSVIRQDNFIRELWSSQIELGEKGVYRGESAVIQMPTSSGKTKSIEIILRAAMISDRTKFAVIITPFRALCRELSMDLGKAFKSEKNIHISELSEVLRNDFEKSINEDFTVIILTPEKLIYLMRKVPEILEDIGLIIFDEAHLFDDPTRGIKYELLMTTIKIMFSSIQKIVISAIISNADVINQWINEDNGKVIENNKSLVSEKSIAFIERTLKSKNQFSLHFIENEDINKEKYFVPKIVSKTEINKIGGETKDRFFPEENQLNRDIAISIANRLCVNGGVAIFCGRKDSAKKLVERIIEIEKRGVNIQSFFNVSDKNEVNKIYNLIVNNMGSDNSYAIACKKGVFSHHANIPEGVKASVEFAMRNGKIKVVVCTSTLAQGVNLPIRYLIVPTIYQAGEEIKVRDFQNLAGRTGRAGMYTEGNIIFTEPEIFSRRSWKRSRYQYLLNKSNSEPCRSHILKLIEYKNDNIEMYNYIIDEYRNYDIDKVTRNVIRVIDEANIDDKEKENIKIEVLSLINILKDLENFILFVLGEEELSSLVKVTILIENTLAFYLADEAQKILLKEVIGIIYEKVTSTVIDTKRKNIYGRTMLSLKDIITIEEWIAKNIDDLEKIENIEYLINVIFGLLSDICISKKVREKIEKKDSLIELYKLWVRGNSYYDILKYIRENDIKIRIRTNYRLINIDEIIEICNDSFGYKASIVLSAIQEIVQAYELKNENIESLLDKLCRRTRYGLNSIEEVIIYEMGFNDRYVASSVKKILGITSLKKADYVRYMRRFKIEINKFLEDLPSVFKDNLEYILKANK